MKNIERQIKYNIETDFDEQTELRYTWTILIVNEPREINRITQRFSDQLSDSRKFRRGKERYLIADSNPVEKGLHYRVFTMKSTCGELPNEDKMKIYNQLGKFKKERDFTPNKDEIWFDEIYIPRLRK